jgi:carbon storage regulator CsrA
MLILSRRVGQTVVIGNNITVTVIRLKGKQIRIGVCAPDSVRVLRAEVAERLRRRA